MRSFAHTLFLCCILLISCSDEKKSKEVSDTIDKEVDSIFYKSQINIVKSDSIIKKSDKAISNKVKETLVQITDLKEEVKETRSALEKVISNPKIIKVVDTIYIESKKNFWGKEKTSVKVISDSTILEDTTNHN